MVVVKFPKRLSGNGAREALERVLDEQCDLFPPEVDDCGLGLQDRLLAGLWVEGFKVVPLGPEDK